MSNFVLEVNPHIDSWLQVLEHIEQLSTKQQWSAQERFDVTLICEEWLINIINHGQCRSDQTILIKVEDLPPDKIIIFFSDPGIPFTPFQEPITSERSAHINQNYGGLGLFFIQSKISGYQYQNVNKRNQLTMYYSKKNEGNGG